LSALTLTMSQDDLNSFLMAAAISQVPVTLLIYQIQPWGLKTSGYQECRPIVTVFGTTPKNSYIASLENPI
jgi:hypothetical protein